MFFVVFDHGMAIFDDINEAAVFMGQHTGCIMRGYSDKAEQWQGIQWLYRNYWEKLVSGEMGDVDITLPTVDDLKDHKVFEPHPRPVRRLGNAKAYAVIGWDKSVVAILSTASALTDFVKTSGTEYVEVTEVSSIGAAYIWLNSRLYGGFAFAMPYGTAPYCPIRGLEADVIYQSPSVACFQQLLGQIPEAMQPYCNRLQMGHPLLRQDANDLIV